jgi:peptidoglycan/LPS O-acetylase OafA/YrhL
MENAARSKIEQGGAQQRPSGSAPRADQIPAHIPALDGIRGLAVLAVMLFHFSSFTGVDRIPPLMILRLGWAGVNLFFVLSGFLITGILLRTKASPNYFVSFYARRFLRIFPVYYATLLAILWAGSSIPRLKGMMPPSPDWIYYWTYLSNWNILLASEKTGAVGHFWSLAVEEQFYLVWPWLVWNLSPRQLMRTIAVACCAAPLIRLALVFGLHWEREWVYRNVFSQMDALLLGAAAALMLRDPAYRTLLASAGKVLCGSLAALTVVILGGRSLGYRSLWMLGPGSSLLGLLFSSAIVLVVPSLVQWRGMARVFETRGLRILGRYSYGLYVYHIPLFVLWRLAGPGIPYSGPGSGLLMMLIYFVTSFAVATLSYELLERRILGLKRFFEPAILRT